MVWYYCKLLLFNVILFTTYTVCLIFICFIRLELYKVSLQINNKVLYLTRRVCSEVSDVRVSLDFRRELSN